MSLAELLHLTRPFIIFDLETTSTDKSTARACQLGMHVHKPNGEMTSYATLINPIIPMPKDASDVHGITDEIIRTGCSRCWQPAAQHPDVESCQEFKRVPRFSDIASNLLKGFSDADFGGYNVKFDLRILEAEFMRCRLAFDMSQSAIIDGHRIWQILEPRTLTDATKHFPDVDPITNAHEALADVISTEEVIVSQLTHNTKLPRDVKKLHELCWPRDANAIDSEGKFIFINSVPCFNFGKHKGKAVESERGYLQWMAGKEFSVEVKRLITNILAGNPPVQS